jgi:hypothetical protein
MTNVRTIRPRSARHGLMLIELCMGLVVTAMIGGAIASFCLAVSSSWQGRENEQALAMQSSQTKLRMRDALHSAKYFGYPLTATTSGSTVMFWAEDGSTARGTTSDGKIQYAEIGLLQYNSTAKTIELYTVPTTTALGANWAYSAICSAGTINTFRSGLTAKTLASNVTSATFTVSNGSTNIAPSLQYTITFSRNGESVLETGSVSLRGSGATPP